MDADRYLSALCKKSCRHLRLKSKIGGGASANVYIATMFRNRKPVVVKKIFPSQNKVYCELFEPNDIFCVRNADVKDIKCLTNTESDYCADWLYAMNKTDGADKIHLLTNFLTEAMVGITLRTYLSHLSFVHVLDAWSSGTQKYLAMNFAGTAMDECKLSLQHVQSIVIQVLVILAEAQDVCRFKHHDLHIGNVFLDDKIVKNPIYDGWEYILPISTISATIADFGFSSITDPVNRQRFGRMDFDLLGVKADWGTWSNNLDQYEGYDICVFLHSLREFGGSVADWIDDIFEVVPELQSVRMSKEGRPIGKIRVRPHDVLSQPMMKKFRRAHTSKT